MKEAKKYLIVIVGPTAIGKTSLSIQLAKKLNCEIISADSRQFFKELSIGTAKPSLREQEGIRHHFIHSHSIQERYNVGQYEIDAIQKIEELHRAHPVCIVVGGSGLYVNAICDGIDDIPSSDEIREQLNKRLNYEGLESLQSQLKTLDPEHYEKCIIKNSQRVIRALEVCLVSGATYTSFRTQSKKERPFEIIKIGLTLPREELYGNINRRVDIMIENGLIEEAQSVNQFKELNSLNTVGYKELFQYFDVKITKEEAISKIKQNTRNFAKRQMTWFNKDESTRWFSPSDYEEICIFLDAKLT